jgi:hypothetical protein
MRLRSVLRAVLLLFVGTSVAFLVVKEIRGRRHTRAPDSLSTLNAEPVTGDMPSATPGQARAVRRKVTAYYFYGSVRCMTCRALEAYADEAIRAGFPDALKEGRLEWKPVNVDEPGNGHYVEDFSLTTRSVVLAEVVDGQRKRWRNLKQIWDLVSDKDAYLRYVREETIAFLEARSDD